MKKISKIIISVIVILTVIAVLLFLSFYKKSSILTFITVPYDYIIKKEVDKDPLIYIPIFVDEKDSSFFSLNNIVRTKIKATNGDYFMVYIDNIKEADMASYDGKSYYEYDLTISLPLSSDEVLNINNAYLEFEYVNEEKLALNIGNICIYELGEVHNLTISRLRGFTMDIENKKMLAGTLIKFNHEEDVTITNIEPLSCQARINKKEVYKTDEEFTLPDNYEIIGKNDNSIDIELGINDYLFIGLSYDEYCIAPQIGYVIYYTMNDTEYKEIISPFSYYKTDDQFKIEKYEYETNYH